MKEIVLENIFNQELVRCPNPRDIEIIDGIEYLKVQKQGQAKFFLMRKDSLKRVAKKIKA